MKSITIFSRLIVLLTILFTNKNTLLAQVDTIKKKEPSGSFIVNADPRLNVLIEKRKHLRNPNQKVDGYKVQIFFSHERSKAEYYKNHFTNKYGNKYDIELIWTEPNFRVYAGRFYTKAEADKLYNQIKDKYPNVLIIKTKIPKPKVNEEEDDEYVDSTKNKK